MCIRDRFDAGQAAAAQIGLIFFAFTHRFPLFAVGGAAALFLDFLLLFFREQPGSRPAEILGSGATACRRIRFVGRLGGSDGLRVQLSREVRHVVVQDGMRRCARRFPLRRGRAALHRHGTAATRLGSRLRPGRFDVQRVGIALRVYISLKLDGPHRRGVRRPGLCRRAGWTRGGFRRVKIQHGFKVRRACLLYTSASAASPGVAPYTAG